MNPNQNVDLSDSIIARSDQLNYDDFIGLTRTVTVQHVQAGNREQPIEIHTHEFPGKPYKPSKSMRRVLVAAWGANGADYAGRAMTLYGDPTVKFGGEAVGGIKISHLSHINKPLDVSLTVTRGKRAPHTVHPLPARDTSPAPVDVSAHIEALMNADTMQELKAAWENAVTAGAATHPDVATAKDARKEALSDAA